MKNAVRGTIIAVALATLIAPSTAEADLILGNQPSPSTQLGNIQIGASGRQAAVGLTTPAGGPIVLGNVVLELSASANSGDPLVTIQSDNAGAPSGTVLATLDIPTGFQTGGRPLYTFNDPSAFEFQPSTTYWVVLERTRSTAGNARFLWMAHAGAPVATSDLGVTFFGSRDRTGSGAWTRSPAMPHSIPTSPSIRGRSPSRVRWRCWAWEECYC